MTTELQQAVNDFSQAEQALRAIIDNADSLRSATITADDARSTLEEACEAVNRSHGSLQELAGRLSETAESLRDASEQMRTAATALEAVDPDRMVAVGEETQAELHKLGTRLQQIVEARTSEVTDAILSGVASGRQETASEIRSISTEVGAVAATVNSLEAAARSGDERGDRLEQALDAIAKRQSLILMLTIAVLVVGVANAVGAFWL